MNSTTDPGTTRAYELTLEFHRAAASDDGKDYAFRLEPQKYNLRHPDGTDAQALFPWGPDVIGHLTTLQRDVTDRRAALPLGEIMRSFLDTLRFDAYEAQIEEAQREGRPIHITIRSTAAELYALPWELVPVQPTGQSLGALARCLIRYEWPGTHTATPALPTELPGGRILFAWSTAGGRVPADVHINALYAICKEGNFPFHEDADVIPNVSLTSLKTALEKGPFAALHILCHGAPVSADAESFGLVFNAQDGGNNEVIDAVALRDALGSYAGEIRLVTLSACQGADPGALDSRLGSVAQALHRVGFPAVIASRYPLHPDASTVLVETLYRRLLVGGPEGEPPCTLEEACVAVREKLLGRANRLDWASLQLYAREDGPAMRPFVLRPYRGSSSFEREHRRYFFGRSADVTRGLAALKALTDPNGSPSAKPRLLFVTGASGVGKSSLVLAGIVPLLVGAPASRCVAKVLRPGGDAMAALDKIVSAPRDASAEILLVVDPFEDFCARSAGSAEEASHNPLVKRLWALASDPASGVTVIALARVAALARCGRILLDDSGLRLDQVASDEAHRLSLPQMTRDQLREVIEGPAQVVGLTLDSGLRERLLIEVANEPGALQLLEFALDLIWQRRDGSRLVQEGYDGVLGAYDSVLAEAAKVANKVIDELSADQKPVARRLLINLVSLGETATPDTRRRASTDALRPAGDAEGALFDRVLDRLVDARIVVEDADEQRPMVQIAHERYIRSWPRLRAWLTEDRERLHDLGKLQDWVNDYEQWNDLLVGKQLLFAQELLKKHPEDVGEKARRLIELSLEGAIEHAVHSRIRRELMLERSARLLLARGRAAWASKLLLELEDPAEGIGWLQIARDVLDKGLPRVTLSGHEGAVTFAAMNLDGTIVVTVSDDQTARVWHADGKGEPVVLSGHQDKVIWAAVIRDGKRVVTASWDGTARVWSLDGKTPPVVLSGHHGRILGAALSPDGRRLVTASEDMTARVWSTDGAGEAIVLSGHTDRVNAVAYCTDGKRVVTASDDKTARVWSADGSGEAVILAGHADRVATAAFFIDAKRVVTGSDDKTARVWSADGKGEPIVIEGGGKVTSAIVSRCGTRVIIVSSEGVQIASAGKSGPGCLLTGPVDVPLAVGCSSSGFRIVTTSDDKTVRVWSSDGGVSADKVEPFPVVLQGHEGRVIAAAMSSDTKYVVTVSADRAARVWDAGGSSDPAIVRGRAQGSQAVIVSLDGEQVVTTAVDGTVRVWNAAGKGAPTSPASDPRITGAALSPDGKHVITVSVNGTVTLWNADGTGGPMDIQTAPAVPVVAAFSPDGLSVVTASADGTARVWSTEGIGEPVVSSIHKAPLRCAAFSPDGLRVVTASEDGRVAVWSADGAGQPIFLEGHESAVVAVAFSPDNKRVVTASEDQTARVWSADGTAQAIVLEGHESVVVAAAFSPDNKRVVTASMDGTARVWSPDGDAEPLVLRPSPLEMPRAVAFRQDGERVITVSLNGTVCTWAVTVDSLFRCLHEANNDCLPPTLRSRYLGETPPQARDRYEACMREHGRRVP